MNTLSVRARVGFWLAVVLGVVDVAGAFVPAPPGADAPPLVVMLLSAVLGVITLAAAVVVARSGSRPWLRVMAGSRILSGLTALPAFFLAVPAPFVVWGAATVVLTIVAVVLLTHRPRADRTGSGTARTPVAG